MTAPSNALVPVGGFGPLTPIDYQSLPLVERVQYLIQATAESHRRTLTMSVDLGLALLELKLEMPHGEWIPWLQDNFPRGPRMAQMFMDLARNAKFVSQLPPETSIQGALKFVRDQRKLERGPSPTPDQETDGDADVALEPVLLRYCPPGMPTHVIVRGMVNVFFGDAQTCLDVTYGSGNFWSTSAPVKVVAHDLDETRAPDGTMDFTNLHYDDATFDLVVFDPPHLADGGDDSVMTGKFGTVKTQDALEELIEAGAREAWRVCAKGLIVKVTDHTHGQRFHDMSMLVCDAIATWPYDKVHQVRDHAFIDPSWGEQLSAYSNGSTYLIFRKGDERHIARRRGN